MNGRLERAATTDRDGRVLAADVIREALLVDDASAMGDPQAAAMRAMVDAVQGYRPGLAAQCHAVHDGPIDLDSVRAPTLVIAGDEDLLAARPDRLVRALPDGTLCIVAGDHFGAVLTPSFTPTVAAFFQTSWAWR